MLDARYSLTRNGSENGGIGGLNTFDRRTNNESQSDTVVSSLVTLFGSNKVNEARARYTYNTTDCYSPLTAERRRGVADARLLERAGLGQPRRRRQHWAADRAAAEPGREAAAVRQQLLDS